MNAAQGLDLLQRKVDILGGKSLGPWTVDCETLQSTQTLSEHRKGGWGREYSYFLMGILLAGDDGGLAHQ